MNIWEKMMKNYFVFYRCWLWWSLSCLFVNRLRFFIKRPSVKPMALIL